MFESRKSKIAGLIVGGMLLVGSISGAAFAATSNSQPTVDQPDKAALEFVSRFATNLGVSQDKVTAALDATKKQVLQQAVQQGQITQAEADKIAAEKDNFGFEIGDSHHEDLTKNVTFLNNAAKVLGETPDQLKSELLSGKKLSQIVTDHKMTMAQFRQKMPQDQEKNDSATDSNNNQQQSQQQN